MIEVFFCDMSSWQSGEVFSGGDKIHLLSVCQSVSWLPPLRLSNKQHVDMRLAGSF